MKRHLTANPMGRNPHRKGTKEWRLFEADKYDVDADHAYDMGAPATAASYRREAEELRKGK